MFNPCTQCQKGEYNPFYCSSLCEYAKNIEEVKMLRRQVEKTAEVLGGNLVEGNNAYTCAIEDLQKLLRDDFHEIGIITVIWAIKALKHICNDKQPLDVEQLKEISSAVENGKKGWVWIKILDSGLLKPGIGKESAYYQTQMDYTRGRAFVCGYPGISYGFDYMDYGKKWLAYRICPDAEEM